MKSSYIILLALFIYCSAQVYKNDIIHEKAEFGKVSHNRDGSNLVISKLTDNKGILISKLDKNGNFLYHNKQINNLVYTGNAQIMESRINDGEDQNGYTLYHKVLGKEYLTQIKEQAQEITRLEYTTFQEQVSALTLTNGNILFIGITKPAANYVETRINLKVIDPRANSELSGESIIAYSKYISCYEQQDNEVYCAYV